MSKDELTDFEKALQKKLGSKKVFICSGSDCTLAGTQKQLFKNLREYFLENEIGTLNCIGLCHKNHSFRLNNKKYSAKNTDELSQIMTTEGLSN